MKTNFQKEKEEKGDRQSEPVSRYLSFIPKGRKTKKKQKQKKTEFISDCSGLGPCSASNRDRKVER